MIELDENTTNCTEEKDEYGRRKIWTEETRDADGVLISKRVDEYSYYPSGEIHKIVLRRYDASGVLVSEKEIKHEAGSLEVIEIEHEAGRIS